MGASREGPAWFEGTPEGVNASKEGDEAKRRKSTFEDGERERKSRLLRWTFRFVSHLTLQVNMCRKALKVCLPGLPEPGLTRTALFFAVFRRFLLSLWLPRPLPYRGRDNVEVYLRSREKNRWRHCLGRRGQHWEKRILGEREKGTHSVYGASSLLAIIRSPLQLPRQHLHLPIRPTLEQPAQQILPNQPQPKQESCPAHEREV